jgi:predicted dehydrogenase
MKKVRLGLIGMGMIGKLHAETMSRMKDLEFVAASDVDAKHQKTAEELGTKYYQSYEEMIGKEKLDGVVVAVPKAHLPVGATCERKAASLDGSPLQPILKPNRIQAARRTRFT